MPTTTSHLTCWITVDDQVELASGLFQMRDTSASSARRSVADSASCAYMRAWLLLLPRSFKSALSLSATQFPVITPRCSYQTVACTGPHYRSLATLQQPGRHLQNALQNALSTEVHPALFPRSRTQFLCCPGRHFCKHLSRWGGRLRAALRSDRCRRRHRLSLFRYRRAPRTMCFYHRMLMLLTTAGPGLRSPRLQSGTQPQYRWRDVILRIAWPGWRCPRLMSRAWSHQTVKRTPHITLQLCYLGRYCGHRFFSPDRG